jgi:hypothetical protein
MRSTPVGHARVTWRGVARHDSIDRGGSPTRRGGDGGHRDDDGGEAGELLGLAAREGRETGLALELLARVLEQCDELEGAGHRVVRADVRPDAWLARVEADRAGGGSVVRVVERRADGGWRVREAVSLLAPSGRAPVGVR